MLASFLKPDFRRNTENLQFGLRPDFRGIMLEHPLYFFQISPSARHLPLKKLRQIAVKVTLGTIDPRDKNDRFWQALGRICQNHVMFRSENLIEYTLESSLVLETEHG